MQLFVFTFAFTDHQITRVIVETVFIFVVNFITFRERATKYLLRYVDMLIAWLSVDLP
jgi:hypothetical protein